MGVLAAIGVLALIYLVWNQLNDYFDSTRGYKSSEQQAREDWQRYEERCSESERQMEREELRHREEEKPF